jgi:hypothetical protein
MKCKTENGNGVETQRGRHARGYVLKKMSGRRRVSGRNDKTQQRIMWGWRQCYFFTTTLTTKKGLRIAFLAPLNVPFDPHFAI